MKFIFRNPLMYSKTRKMKKSLHGKHEEQK